MKNAKDEDYYILIPNPINGDKEEFDLNNRANIGLAMRLIKKRHKAVDKMQSNFEELESIRKDRDVDSIDAKIKKLVNKVSSLDPDEFETDEEYSNRIDELEKKLKDVKDSYPQKVIDLQNKTGQSMQEIDRLGIKICSLILNPVDGVPDEYPSKKDFIEELIADDKDIEDIISFFLDTLNSTMKSHRDEGIQMKKRSKNKQ